MKIGISKEERKEKMRKALILKGIDYDEYMRIKAQKKIKKEPYHFTHEDNVQFGFVPPDVIGFCI